MKITKEDTEQALTLFKPIVSDKSICMVSLNMKYMPNENDIAPQLSSYNRFRMSDLSMTSKNPHFDVTNSSLPTELMRVVKGYLHETPVTYDTFKIIWYASYIDQLKQLRKDSEFNVAYYDVGTDDHLWTSYKIKRIGDMIDTLMDDIPISQIDVIV